jgi:antitoxin component of MazEF toxin-antitoxin module
MHSAVYLQRLLPRHDNLVGLWLNGDWNIEISSAETLKSKSFIGTVIFKRIYRRGGSMSLVIPPEILDTLELLGLTHMKSFDISVTHDKNIVLSPIYEDMDKKNESHLAHLRKYYWKEKHQY